MPITYKICKKLRLLYTIFNGSVNSIESHKYLDTLFRNPDINYTNLSLVYLKDSKLTYNVEDVEMYAVKLMKYKKFRFLKKIAILIDNPTDTVAATIFSQTITKSSKTTSIELFSTLDAALVFLDLYDNQSEIEKTIKHYIKSFK